MRLLKFFSVFLITAILVFGFIIGLNWKPFNTFFENREAMMEGSELVENTYSLRALAEFIGEYPEYVSVASRVVGSPDSTLYYQPDAMRVMGTSSNIFILLGYAIELDKGSISETDPVYWDEVSRYQMPDLDESVHRQARNTAGERGWLDNGAISLERALRLLAEFNDLALADYLWWNLDSGIWDEIKGSTGLTFTEMPLPYSGLYLAISPHFQNQTVSELIEEWSRVDEQEWRNHVTNLSRQYTQDGNRRDEIRSFMQSNRLGNTFMEERDAMSLFPKTTAEEMVIFMETLWLNEVINRDVSERIKDWMRWPMEAQDGIRRDFTDYGAIYDNRMGLLNGFDFGTSAYTGDTTVQAIFFDQLPIGFWFHMSSNHMHQDFQQRLIFDPALIEQMQTVTQKENP